MGAVYQQLKGTRAYAKYTFLSCEMRPSISGPEEVCYWNAKWFNCFGDIIWETRIHARGGAKVKTSGYVDMRSLEATALGCCPPALMKDFVMQEGGELAERDPVMEAMKLHKRGYFGGGG